MPIKNMNQVKIILIIFFMLFINVYSQKYPAFLPEQIKSFLVSNYPEWHLINNMSVLKESLLLESILDTNKCKPNLVWGDFNGDNKTDYCLFLERTIQESTKEQLLIAFVSFNKIYKQFVLEKEKYPAYVAEFIWLNEKGSKIYNYETDKEFILKNDCIDSNVVEKASITYLFKKNKFIKIISAD